MLGKPVESIPREGIRAIAEGTDNWPVGRYFTAVGLDPAIGERWPWNKASRPTSLLENIDGMPEDDDLNFTMLATLVLEQSGSSFTSLDIAKAWLDYLPPGRIFTAERIACRNLLLGLLPPQTATFQNPFREWIGARLRVDAYGWSAPGDPERAARMAWEDARLSHTANGVYAAMFMAAAHAATLADVTAADAADLGLQVVPARSRLAEAIRFARAQSGEWESVVDALYERFGSLHWVHAINNTALVAAVMYRFTSFDEAIGAVVAGGWDTDTNGAAIGSIFGRSGRSRRDRSALERAVARHRRELAAWIRRELDRRACATHARGRVTSPADPWSPRPVDRPTTIDGDLDAAKIIAAPDDPDEWPAWRASLTEWRRQARARLGYTGQLYDRPEFAWTQGCFSVALVWLWDELLYDFEAERFTPERLLAEGAREFGGFDAVVLWHAYPVIGIDDRNQFDWYRDVPGLAALVADLQARGVRVFVDYNPWDTGTRREPVDDAHAVAEIVRLLDADGVFLDTMKEAPETLRRRARRDPSRDWRSRASRRCRSPGSGITTCRGRSGSPTATCRV